MNIKTKIEVKFSSGAVVKLTDTQEKEVTQFVEEMLVGEKPTVRRKIRKTWTEAEDKELLVLENAGNGKAYTVAEQIGEKLGRNKQSVMSRFNRLRIGHVKPRKKRDFGPKIEYTPEDDKRILEEFNDLDSHERAKKSITLSQELNRTPRGVMQRFYKLENDKRDSDKKFNFFQ